MGIQRYGQRNAAAPVQYGASNITIVSSDRLGHAMGHDGYKYYVSYTQHDRAWPGADTDYPDTTFVVSREGSNGIDKSWGFHTEDEAWDFLTGLGPMEYTHWSQFGQPIQEVRERLGVPDGMVKKYRTDANTGYIDADYAVNDPRTPVGQGSRDVASQDRRNGAMIQSGIQTPQGGQVPRGGAYDSVPGSGPIDAAYGPVDAGNGTTTTTTTTPKPTS